MAECSKKSVVIDAEALNGNGGGAEASLGWLSPSLCARTVTSVTGFADGYDFGSLSGALVLMRGDVALTSWQVGACVGVAYLAMGAGAPIGGSLADIVGRKKALAVTYVLLIVGSIGCALATNFEQFFVARVLLGCGVGAGFSVVSTYMTEVSPKTLRGYYVGLEDLFLVIGILVGYVFNFLLTGIRNDWRWMLGLGAVCPAFSLLLLLLPQVPESPRWEMLRGNRETAIATLVSIVGDEEAARMLEEWKDSPQACSWVEVFRPRSAWRLRALAASIGVWVAAMVAAISILTVYMAQIFAEEIPARQGFLLTALMAALRVGAIALTVFYLMDRAGRRILTLISCGGVVVTLAMLSALYHMKASVIPWKVIVLTCYFVFYSLGLAAIPYVYSPEVLPTDMRGKGVSLGILCARLSAGCITWCFPIAKEAFGIPVVFAGLAAMNVGCLIFLYIFMQESAGVSLEEMHHLFRKAKD